MITLAIATTIALSPRAFAQPAVDGPVTIAVHVSLAPTWFDPAETPGVITPFLTLYALHDALVKPMPGNAFAPSLAESWTASQDGLSYEFALRKGVKFHNGDALTAEDVKYSCERYKGPGATTLKARVAAVEIVDPHRVRFRMKRPWPDFMTFYGTPATGAAWIVPKAYTERVGEEGFKKAPVGAGPYRFVSFNPGIELVLAANLAIDRKAINEAEYLGYGKVTASMVPRAFEFFWNPPAYPYDPAKAKQLLAEAGYAKGFDAGEVATDAVYAPEAEAVVNGLQAIGIRARLKPMERAG